MSGAYETPASAARKPTVCHLFDRSDGNEAEALAIELARQLHESYRFIFICLGKSSSPIKALALEGAPVHSIVRREGLDWDCSQRLGRLLQRERVDLLHTHQSGAFLHGLIARLFYRRPAVLFTEHERLHLGTPSLRSVVVKRMLLEGRDQVVASSHSVRQALILNEGIPSERVAVIYNSIVAPATADDDRDGQSVRREIGLDADALLILQPARFDPWQNHPLALRTLEYVVRSIPEARLVLVGQGPERGMIEELAREQGLGTHVLFLEPRDDQGRLYLAADVVLLTGLGEGVPQAVIQALAAGRPVVATRVGGVSEIVEDRLCGLLACPGDYVGLAEHIRSLGMNRELRAQFGRRGQERIQALSTEASTPLLYSNLYCNMLAH
jgi:glycosyltransferase involved in cell wall biosynthesis